MAKSNGSTGSDAARKRAKARTTTRATKKPSGAAADKPATPRAASATKASKPAARRGGSKLPKPVTGAINAALDKKAEDVVVLDLRKTGGFTDFFLICTGANPRQITAIAEGVRETLKRDFEERPTLA